MSDQPATSAQSSTLNAFLESTAQVTPRSAPSSSGIMDGLINREQLCIELDCSGRTITRYEHAGMPVIRLGKDRLYEPPKVRAWILTHERCPKPVVRGRPAAKRAA